MDIANAKCLKQYDHWRQTGLNSVGASISTTSGRGRKRGTLICIISERGRKTVGASAPTAPTSSAPLNMTKCQGKERQ